MSFTSNDWEHGADEWDEEVSAPLDQGADDEFGLLHGCLIRLMLRVHDPDDHPNVTVTLADMDTPGVVNTD